jgi:chitin synthase
MSYGYQNLGGHSQSNLGPGGSNNAPSSSGGGGAFADPADAENQYEDYYSHPQAGGVLPPPQYPSYGGNSPQQVGGLEPPYLHPGYTHNQSYASNYGSNSPANLRHDSASPSHTGSPAPTYGNLPPSDSGRDVLQPVGPRIMGAGSNDEPNVAPHQAIHWVSADQHGRLGVPGVNDGNNNSMYPSYSGDTFTSNVNPFDAPMDQPLPHGSHPHEDIPLLDQHGRQGSGYSQAMLPGAMPMGPGGFMDPNMMHDDDDELSQVRYGRIPQRVPRRLKTIKQGELVVLIYHVTW